MKIAVIAPSINPASVYSDFEIFLIQKVKGLTNQGINVDVFISQDSVEEKGFSCFEFKGRSPFIKLGKRLKKSGLYDLGTNIEEGAILFEGLRRRIRKENYSIIDITWGPGLSFFIPFLS